MENMKLSLRVKKKKTKLINKRKEGREYKEGGKEAWERHCRGKN